MDSEDDAPESAPFDALYFVLTVGAVVLGLFSFGLMCAFAHVNQVSPGVEWYHSVPSVLGVLAVLSTGGATLIPPDKNDLLFMGDAYATHTRMFHALQLLAISVFTFSQWATACLFSYMRWGAAGEYRMAAAIVIIQAPYAGALLLRWRQLVVEYQKWSARKRREAGLDL